MTYKGSIKNGVPTIEIFDGPCGDQNCSMHSMTCDKCMCNPENANFWSLGIKPEEAVLYCG